MSLSEKEKMLRGIEYKNTDKELHILIEEKKAMLDEYNRLGIYEKEKRDILIKKILKKTGEKIWIHTPFPCDYGNIEVGENFLSHHNCVILDEAKVTFGDNCLVAPNVGIYTVGHVFDIEKRKLGYEYAYPITIGNNVWIGGNCAVLPGVTIGDNSVIGAGSVVNRDIPKNCVAAGNPCKVIRNL